MLDLKLIRDNPERVRDAMRRRGESVELIDRIVKLDEDRRRYLQEVETLKHQRNRTSQMIPTIRDQNERQQLISDMRTVGDRIKELDQIVTSLDSELTQMLLVVPNIPNESVPFGASEDDNVVVRHWGEPPRFEFDPLPHWELGESLGLIDFERASKISGARFYILKGLGAKLERSLISFMLDLHVDEHGYTEIYPPYLIKRECMVGTGQLPKFEEDMYRTDADDLFLDPTAEVPLTNMYREEILESGTLPIRNVGYTACFRREAGSAGRDTRGLIRVHQFDKVELVKLVEPSTSYDELDRLVQDAETVLRRLNMAYRVTMMCTADVGFAAAKKFDLEVWMPGQDRYVEISSCSNFEDFQARRANIRYRPSATAKPEFAHTLNGSGLAVGRTLAALLETYQQKDGSVVVPEALRAYMGGLEVIR